MSAGEMDNTADLQRLLGCGRAKVYRLAREHGIGLNLGGRAGWRFSEADKAALIQAMKPKPAPSMPSRRPKRRRR